MADTVKIPLLGNTKKTTAYALGVAAVAVVGFGLYRARKAKAATATTPTNPIDPATGFPYGSPEDAQALAGMSAYQNPVDYGGGGGPAPGSSGAPVVMSTNAQWSQAALDYLVNTVGAPASVVSDALGRYVGGRTLANDAEVSYIQQAIAFVGTPPVGGPNGYPPSYKPPVPAPPIHNDTLPAVHLSLQSRDAHNAVIVWTKATAGTGYFNVRSDGHAYKVVLARVNSLQVPRGHTYSIIPFSSNETPGRESNKLRV